MMLLINDFLLRCTNHGEPPQTLGFVIPPLCTSGESTARWFSEPERIVPAPSCCSFKKGHHKCDLSDVELITCPRERLGQEPETMSCVSIAL